MKTNVLILLLLLAARAGFARLGETEAQTAARYGPPISRAQVAPGVLGAGYLFQDCQIDVFFLTNQSMGEIVTFTNGQAFTDDARDFWIRNISGEGIWRRMFKSTDRLWTNSATTAAALVLNQAKPAPKLIVLFPFFLESAPVRADAGPAGKLSDHELISARRAYRSAVRFFQPALPDPSSAVFSELGLDPDAKVAVYGTNQWIVSGTVDYDTLAGVPVHTTWAACMEDDNAADGKLAIPYRRLGYQQKGAWPPHHFPPGQLQANAAELARQTQESDDHLAREIYHYAVGVLKSGVPDPAAVVSELGQSPAATITSYGISQWIVNGTLDWVDAQAGPLHVTWTFCVQEGLTDSGDITIPYDRVGASEKGALPPRRYTPEQLQAQTAAAARQKDLDTSARKTGADKALLFNQSQADKGDAYGELRMGERYRDGEGVAKDLAKAKDYFTKAAAQGNPTAASDLKALGN